ncbi:MAG: DUF1624 domain-containing protein [Atopobiaceae bacterium]|nr:DUF1624 domain-containing protein [Atopobiaceae bacterium]
MAKHFRDDAAPAVPPSGSVISAYPSRASEKPSNAVAPVNRPPERLHAFDAIRGGCIVAMVVWHTFWDLVNMYGMRFGSLYSPIMNISRFIGVALFLLTAGVMCAVSRSNLQRGLVYGAVAIAIAVVTYVFPVGGPINFGIIYCMAACTLAAWLLECMGIRFEGPFAAMMLFALYVFLQDLPWGSIGIGAFRIDLPRVLYSTEWFSWLGFPGPTFTSGDYFPLLPSLMCYLAGSALGNGFAKDGWPEWTYRFRFAPFEWVGRNSLLIYVIHQPIIVGILSLVLR